MTLTELTSLINNKQVKSVMCRALDDILVTTVVDAHDIAHYVYTTSENGKVVCRNAFTGPYIRYFKGTQTTDETGRFINAVHHYTAFN